MLLQTSVNLCHIQMGLPNKHDCKQKKHFLGIISPFKMLSVLVESISCFQKKMIILQHLSIFIASVRVVPTKIHKKNTCGISNISKSCVRRDKTIEFCFLLKLKKLSYEID